MSYSRFLEYLEMGRVKKVGAARYACTQAAAMALKQALEAQHLAVAAIRHIC